MCFSGNRPPNSRNDSATLSLRTLLPSTRASFAGAALWMLACGGGSDGATPAVGTSGEGAGSSAGNRAAGGATMQGAGTGGAQSAGGSGGESGSSGGGSSGNSSGSSSSGSSGSISSGGSGSSGSSGSSGGSSGSSGSGGIGSSGGGGSSAGNGSNGGSGGAVDVCKNGQKDGAETDSDCGGPTCAPCATGKQCKISKDCASTFCDGAMCVATACSDKVVDGAETDVDCGGPSCGPCAVGHACKVAKDCASTHCNGAVCVDSACKDKALDGAETDVDCGGGACPTCALGQKCALGSDCASGFCDGTACVDSSCKDKVVDGSETGIDCGGPTCAPCAPGAACLVPADCASNLCAGGVCVGVTTSCAALHAAQPTLPSGVYSIKPDGAAGPKPAFDVWCDMTGDGGGWTLILKADGTQPTFVYEAAAWLDASTLNVDHPAFDDGFEAKLESYNSVPVTEVRVGLQSPVKSGQYRYLVLPLPSAYPSFGAMMAPDVLVPTAAGRAAWLGLIPGSTLQPDCLEGFNAIKASYATRVRIGILGDQEGENCADPDSFLGVGADNQPCMWLGNLDVNSTTSGASACWNPGHFDITVTPAYAAVFVR